MSRNRQTSLVSLSLIGLAVLSLIVIGFAFPNQSLEASLRGISIWWDVLFPALFPFFVISELLLGFGIVHFIGTLFDPMMRPLFRIPGIGGFVMAMGFASGYPIGAKLTASLWEQKLVNREEGERLVAFTTSSDPIFLIGAVSVGFFHDASLALILGTAHYGGAMLIALLMRFHGAKTGQLSASSDTREERRKRTTSIWLQAFNAMHEARVKDGRSLGLLLSEAIGKSLNLMIVVGGLVVFFSVLLQLLTSIGTMQVLLSFIERLLTLVGIPHTLAEPIINGLFEVTLGAKSAGSVGNIALVYKLAAAAFVLSWGGLSVHAQVVSLLSHTNMRYGPFLRARFLHGIIAAILVLLLWQPFTEMQLTSSVFQSINSPSIHSGIIGLDHLLHYFPISLLLFGAAFALLFCLYCVHFIFRIVFRTVIDYDVKR
ncbi:sporulation integral membrane protein YlbJ [Paenibacillus albiflavus]|uniref:Sporulation integral membrane protein YlbJ n=1 Tax=Paenibacillus albiflavus TaxID=2545760 RepID=A0A4R4ED32_9BACL|nr:sporulation integral membrane protein YlbJ [Paenibacillus albiflavus]TCZ75875.1 sporulation integral membrane protein YlbJ [Paenibacillus albiflavus]